MANGEYTAILKETQGVQVVVRKTVIPIWVEPWYERAQIVGFQTVWVWEFVPAEFLKTISLCNSGGQIVQSVNMETVRDRSLMNMWSTGKETITNTLFGS